LWRTTTPHFSLLRYPPLTQQNWALADDALVVDAAMMKMMMSVVLLRVQSLAAAVSHLTFLCFFSRSGLTPIAAPAAAASSNVCHLRTISLRE
jgi:hypothetical protein